VRVWGPMEGVRVWGPMEDVRVWGPIEGVGSRRGCGIPRVWGPVEGVGSLGWGPVEGVGSLGTGLERRAADARAQRVAAQPHSAQVTLARPDLLIATALHVFRVRAQRRKRRREPIATATHEAC
jgi:hypothetical protein